MGVAGCEQRFGGSAVEIVLAIGFPCLQEGEARAGFRSVVVREQA